MRRIFYLLSLLVVIAILAVTYFEKSEPPRKATVEPNAAPKAAPQTEGTSPNIPSRSLTLAPTTSAQQHAPNEGVLRKVDEAFAGLINGKISFYAPDNMQVGERKEVTVELGPSKLVDQINSDIQKIKQDQQGGQTDIADLGISPVMVAELTGNNFSIEPTVRGDQFVSDAHPTIWTWHIEALDGPDLFPYRPTERQLELSVYAVLNIGGMEHRRVIKTYERPIVVNVTLLGLGKRVVSNISDIVVPLGQ